MVEAEKVVEAEAVMAAAVTEADTAVGQVAVAMEAAIVEVEGTAAEQSILAGAIYPGTSPPMCQERDHQA